MTHRYVYLCEDICCIDTTEELDAVRRDMRAMGIATLPVYAGGPDEGEELAGYALTARSFEEMIDSLTDVQRSYIAAALDAFEATMPVDSFGVQIEDLDDDTLAALIVEADALPVQTDVAAAKAGAGVAARLYLLHTGNPAMPETCRSMLRFIEVGS